ncbi:FAD-dependent oxidoreductase [uncultured Clostridium sp.]|uniref:FAD-dependent oxidoreductase n=1 Tax=uncultured Clostridium sp. TaxID=59620 RepID=UPI0026287FEA|nr:FAD-dependent oxidoreductase [uncultured Clostridium sp.]
MEKIYDLVIIGGGPAALSAGVYAGRAKMSTLILEKERFGGQVTTTAEIVNYPGIRETTGPALMEDMRLHAEDFGAEFKVAEVLEVNLEGDVKSLKTSVGEIKARSVIIATGASPRKLGFKGEKEFTGRGVAYCATCDGQFFEGLEVFVVGAGFAAAEEAMFLTKYARKVTIIAREPEFTCAKSIADKVFEHPKVEVRFNTEVLEIDGAEMVDRAKFKNNVTGEVTEHFADKKDGSFGVFIFVGYAPATELFNGKIELDRGYVITDNDMKTNVRGVYAAGDLRIKNLRQIITAVADGAIAATDAEKYVMEEKHRLGIKEEEKVAIKREVKKEEPKAQVSSGNGRSALLNDALRGQIKGVLDRMEKEVTLVSIVDESDSKSIELRDLVLDIADLGDKLNAEIYKKGEKPELELKIHANKFPIVSFLDFEGNYSGVKFHGVPGGHELNSFLLAIYNLAGPGQAVAEETMNEVKALDKKVNVKVAVSLACHVCPEVVVGAQRIAIENENIEVEMLDISLFKDIKDKFKVMSVPAIIVNDDKIYFGAKKIEEIVKLLK